MNVLVTGGEGFIGRHLMNKFVQNRKFGIVSCYDLLNKDDVLDENTLGFTLAANKYDVIVHLAAKTSVEESHRLPEEYDRTNRQGTISLINLANEFKIPKIIYAATAASLIPESSPYALSKLNGERYLDNFDRQHLALRLFNVVGRRNNPSYSGVIDKFRDGIRKEEITIFGDGNQTRDFIHIDDVCDAFITACLTKNKESACIEIGTGKETTINQLAKDMIEKSRKEVKINYKEPRKEVRNSCANIENMKRILGISPERSISEFYL